MQTSVARIACLYGILILFALDSHAAGPFRIGGPATIDNDASCDISLLPAATLLLPYFEVDITSPAATNENTIFTVTNVSQVPQIARVTLWTDLGYPVFTFNLYLTGYDVQSINLFDVIRRGEVAPDEGTGSDVSRVGKLSGTNPTTDFNNPLIDNGTCTNLPVKLPAALATRMQSAFTTGKVPSGDRQSACSTAGGTHRNAVGYATIDVVGRCDSTMPHELSYFASDIRYENVLMGDYHQINGDEDLAQGGTMVHIRAIPEGGTPQTRDDAPDFRVNLPRTFYGEYQHPDRPTLDARQPLPSVFAARWIEGSQSGYETFYKVWRESRNPAACRDYATNHQDLREPVRFDHEENPETYPRYCGVAQCPRYVPQMSSASLIDVSRDDDLPPNSQGAIDGWMYLNLDLDHHNDDFARQAWVVVSMRSEDRFSTDFDALALGNGCTAPVGFSEAEFGDIPIGPAPNKRRP
jgi:hypothetical protein